MSKTIDVKSDPVMMVLSDPKNAKLAPMKAVYAGVGELVTKLASFSIKKVEDYDEAVLELRRAKALIEEMDGAYDKAAGIEEAFVKRCKETYKMIVAPIELGTKDLKSKMQKYQNEQQAKRDKEAAELKFKADQETAKLNATTGKDQEKIVAKIQKIEAKAEAIETYKPKTADRTRKFEVVNADLVPRQYCTPEDKKIRPFIGTVGGPIPEIPGVRIWDDTKISIR